ncbi:recombinase family protein [Empedobacter falsenii]
MLGIYTRTSNSKTNKNDFSIEDQINAGIILAQKLNLEYKIFEDKGISGTNLDRPALMELMHEIKSKQVTYVFAYDQSRIERSMDIWSFFSGVCVAYNIEVYLGDNKIELNDPTSMLVANMMSLFNNFYAKITSQKVKTANRSKAAKGKTHGILAYGLGRDENNNFVEIVEESNVVREIFALSKQGVGSWNIANILNDKGYPTKRATGKWSGTTVDGILKNSIYKGIREFDRNNTVEGAIIKELPFKIIDPILFDEVQILRQNGKIKSGPKNKYNYLLSGLLTCGHCGDEMKGIHKPNSGTSIYRCKNHSKQVLVRCDDSKGINITNLDNFILNIIFQNTVVEDYLKYFKNTKESVETINNIISSLKKDLKVLKTQKTRLLDLLQFSDSKDPDIKIRYTNVVDEIKSKEIDLKRNEDELIKLQNHDPVSKMIENRKLNYNELDKVTIKNICNDAVDTIKITFQENDSIIQVKFKHITHEIAFYHRLRTNQFRFLVPKDKATRLKTIEIAINNRVNSELSITNNDSKYDILKLDSEKYNELDGRTLDAMDDISLEHQVMSDVEDLNEYFGISGFDRSKFDVSLDQDNLLKYVE